MAKFLGADQTVFLSGSTGNKKQKTNKKKKTSKMKNNVKVSEKHLSHPVARHPVPWI